MQLPALDEGPALTPCCLAAASQDWLILHRQACNRHLMCLMLLLFRRSGARVYAAACAG